MAIAFHWLSAVLALGLVVSGLFMARVQTGSSEQFALYQLHKVLGVMLLLLTALRGAWRATRPPPPLSNDIQSFARNAARLVHALLYVFLLAVPLLGWALVSASTFNIPTSLFGLATWPHLPFLSDLSLASRAQIEPVLSRLHAIMAYGLVGLALMHSTAAIMHGPSMLMRMAPGWLKRKSRP